MSEEKKPDWVKWVPFLAGLILQAFILAVSWGALHAQVQENFRTNQQQSEEHKGFLTKDEFEKRHQDLQDQVRDLKERVRDLERGRK